MPAVLGNEVGLLLVDTTYQMELILELGQIVKWNWPYERESERWGSTPLTSFFALGRGRGETLGDVYGDEKEATKIYTTCGRLGAPFFVGGTLALDPIDAAVGWSMTLDLETRAPADSWRVPLVADTPDNVPITEAIEDRSSLGDRPRLMIDTGRIHTELSLEYIDRAWRTPRSRRKARDAWQGHGRVDVHLKVPGLKSTVWIEARVSERSAARYSDENGLRIDGFLGLDLLYRWLPVIDFRLWVLWLTKLSLQE